MRFVIYKITKAQAYLIKVYLYFYTNFPDKYILIDVWH